MGRGGSGAEMWRILGTERGSFVGGGRSFVRVASSFVRVEPSFVRVGASFLRVEPSFLRVGQALAPRAYATVATPRGLSPSVPEPQACAAWLAFRQLDTRIAHAYGSSAVGCGFSTPRRHKK